MSGELSKVEITFDGDGKVTAIIVQQDVELRLPDGSLAGKRLRWRGDVATAKARLSPSDVALLDEALKGDATKLPQRPSPSR